VESPEPLSQRPLFQSVSNDQGIIAQTQLGSQTHWFDRLSQSKYKLICPLISHLEGRNSR